MRKRKTTIRLGRRAQIKAEKINQIRSLIHYGKIETSVNRAKQLSALMDRFLSKSQTKGLSSVRYLEQKTGNRRLAKEIYQYSLSTAGKRKSGFCSVKLSGYQRGNHAERAIVTLIDFKFPEKKKAVKKEEPVTKTKSNA
jgi:large subunit ribosomal protein L17